MRSTSAQMRSLSSQMRRVSSRSPALTFSSRSCAAPRMPESGFLTSCASIAAIAVTERAAFRCVSWRSILCAMVRSCSVSTTSSRSSATGAACTVMTWAPSRGVSMLTPYSETLCPVSRTLAMSAKTGLSSGKSSMSCAPSSVAALASKNCSAAALA